MADKDNFPKGAEPENEDIKSTKAPESTADNSVDKKEEPKKAEKNQASQKAEKVEEAPKAQEAEKAEKAEKAKEPEKAEKDLPTNKKAEGKKPQEESNPDKTDRKGVPSENGEKKRKAVNYVPEKNTSDTPRKVLQVIFALIAIGAAIAAVLLSPAGKRITNKNDNIPNGTVAEENSPTEEVFETDGPLTQGTFPDKTAPLTDPEGSTYTVPPSTEATTNPYKNYSIFIDKTHFTGKESKGITTIASKTDANAVMTVTPQKETGYKELCDRYNGSYSQVPANEKVKFSALSTAYFKEDNGIKTVIYCIDDTENGSIEIKYQYPVSNKEVALSFEMMVSMFKLH